MSYTTRLVPNPLNKLLFVPNYIVDRAFFSWSETDTIVNHCKTLPLSQGRLFNEVDIYNTRNAKTAFINEPTPETQWIYDKLNIIVGYYNDHNFNFELTGLDYLQYAEYDIDGKHEFHMDIALGVPKTIDYRINESMRKITVVMLLNEPGLDFEGGDFLINLSEERVAERVVLNKSNVLLFPSFLLHKVSPVTKGVRKSLTAWINGPKFK